MIPFDSRFVSRFLPLTFLLAGFLSTAHSADNVKPSVAGARPALTVSVALATSTSLPVRLSANGAVAAWQEAIVGAEVGGLRVKELQVQVGDSVQRGQLLATFAAESVQADVALVRANLAEAKANAAEAGANAERARTLKDTGALSAQAINQYLTQEQTALARVASAQAQLDSQMLRLKQTEVLAPDDGIIASRSATVGSVLGAGSEMFRLIRRGRLEWRGEVITGELERIKPGAKVVVTSPGGAQMRGVVRMLAPTVDVTTRKGLVYVDLVGAAEGSKLLPGAFKPGMYVRGDFDLGASVALTVPQSAVVVRDGFSYVYRIGADNRVAQIKVQTGRLVGNQLELLGGLQPNDRVVASGGGFLSDGDLVRVVSAPQPAAAK